MPLQKFHIEQLKQFPNRIIWNMLMNCDFSCSYCYFHDNPDKDSKQHFFTPSEIKDAFNSTNRQWLILLSGGEPFLYPQIGEIITKLSEQHILQISTNLNSDLIYQLPELTGPDRIFAISASLHIEEREKHSNSLTKFIEKCLFLEKAGFNILVNYVAHPSLFHRMESDIFNLKSSGITNITSLTFRGKYNNLSYPEAYSEEQIKRIEKYAIDESESLVARRKTNFKNHYCEAGKNYFSMDINGNINRCGTLHKNYGNLFKGTFWADEKMKACNANECIDCYLGIISVKEKKQGLFL